MRVVNPVASPPTVSRFGKNVGFLVGGTIGSQIISAVSVPIIALIFGPAEYGVFAAIWAGGLTIGSLAAFRYERGLVLAKSERSAAILARLSTVLVYATSALSSLLVFAVMSLTSSKSLDEVLLTATGVAALAITFGLFQVHSQLAIRRGEFKRLARSEVTAVLGTAGSQVTLGLAGLDTAEALVLGGVVGRAAQLAMIWCRHTRTMIVTTDLKRSANAYKKFPRYSFPYSLVAVSGTRLLIVLGAVYLPIETVGLIALAHRLTYLPVTTVASALRRVFIRELSLESHQIAAARLLVVTRWLGVLVLPAIIGIGIVAPWAADNLLLSEWRGTGSFISLLMPAAIALLLTSWMDRVFEVESRQGLALSMEAGSTLLIVALYWWALASGRSAETAVGLFGLLVAAYNILWLPVAWSVGRFDAKRLQGILAMPVVCGFALIVGWRTTELASIRWSLVACASVATLWQIRSVLPAANRR